MAKAEFIKDLHLECDWLISNFQVRKEARAGEIDSLKKAKAVLSGADYSFLQTKRALLHRSSLRSGVTSGEDILTKTYQLANSPYVVGRHGGENRAASVERAARKRDADSEPLDRLNLGGLGMHDGEDDAIQSSDGGLSLLQRSSLRATTGEDIYTKTYQLANSPFVVGRHGGENRAA